MSTKTTPKKKLLRLKKKSNRLGKPNDAAFDVENDEKKPKVTSRTTLTELATGDLKIFHSQGIKQSVNYQTAEAVYGLELTVKPENAKQAVRLMEETVQKLLLPKSQSQASYLSRLTN